jgi:hypothetical protein
MSAANALDEVKPAIPNGTAAKAAFYLNVQIN